MASLCFALAVMSQIAVFVEADGDRGDRCVTALVRFAGSQTDGRGACMDMDDPENINMDYWCDETGPCSKIIKDMVDYCEGNTMLPEEDYEVLKSLGQTCKPETMYDDLNNISAGFMLNTGIGAIFAAFIALAF
eukprot:gnl/TRDRNA2_/TRDRNA2_145583_c0_seq1.p2 gnl/TRDRNA2_/TRDRNA2_145583_c0~~gnl/TRDRNA2_/TRDRNA2_145583_c0_seq1.p2  ORF type:complete len:134 (-),score=30.55 gnl/TRDRNA2_/TRDRNA2_145583_c0_seq1:125-526(-)